MYSGVCDCCGKTMEHWHEGWTCLADKESVLECMDNQSWYTEETGDGENRDLHYCPNCHKVDDDDNLIVDWSRKDLANNP